MEDQINQIMADILGLDVSKLSAGATMDNIETWDSVNHINLCLALEQEFDIQLEVEEMEQMLTQRDVVRVVQDKIAR